MFAEDQNNVSTEDTLTQLSENADFVFSLVKIALHILIATLVLKEPLTLTQMDFVLIVLIIVLFVAMIQLVILV
jgi:hypothetical protein